MAEDMIDRRTLLVAGAGLAAMPGRGRAQVMHPIARTRHGPVRGFRDGGIHAFKGIRYGQDTGLRRFQPPVPPEPWTEPVEAFSYGPASPQRGDEPNQSEDCLFLNVWTPGLDGARRPVMVYIHGGAYATGSGSSPLYDGRRLARDDDVVVVTLNHRLGPLGYAYLARMPGQPFPDSGAVGQLDLILALEWVRDSIAGFGGDPSRVMVFGQSGGGAKIATLMATPRAAPIWKVEIIMPDANPAWRGSMLPITALMTDGITVPKPSPPQIRPNSALCGSTPPTDSITMPKPMT